MCTLDPHTHAAAYVYVFSMYNMLKKSWRHGISLSSIQQKYWLKMRYDGCFWLRIKLTNDYHSFESLSCDVRS